LVVLAVLGLALHETGQIKPLEDFILIIIGPVQRSVAGLVSSGADLFQTFRDVRELRAENTRLQEANNALVSENIRLKEIEAENATLRDLLEFKRNSPTLQTRAADVIGRDTNPLLKYILISVGEMDGIRIGMPVVAGGSRLVGRIAAVSLRSAQVQLLNDAASSVNALVESSRATGLVRGQPDGSLKMEFIRLEETVVENDIILTSGVGGNFPRALIIGQVASVEKRDIDLFQTAIIRPAADLTKLEIVLVITNFEPME
jgi:rod shape-determining protein MreC